MEISSVISRFFSAFKGGCKNDILFLETTPCRYSQSHTHWLFDKIQLLLLFSSSDFVGFRDLRDSTGFYCLLGTINRIIHLVSMQSLTPLWILRGQLSYKDDWKRLNCKTQNYRRVISKAWFHQQAFTAGVNVWRERNQLGSQIPFWIWTRSLYLEELFVIENNKGFFKCIIST